MRKIPTRAGRDVFIRLKTNAGSAMALADTPGDSW